MALVLQKCKQAKTMGNLNGIEKRKSVPQCDFPLCEGASFDLFTIDLASFDLRAD